MAYTINLTDGAIFATVPDGTINNAAGFSAAAPLTLVGKNYAGYGEFLNENFIHLLENGANSVAPGAPLTGQLWWDKASGTMKVYNGTAFKVISGATSSASAPTTNVVGDLWWDNVNQQLKVWNGSTFTLIGPAFTPGTGQTGAIVGTITDNASVDHVVIQLFVNNVLVGVISKDPQFTPQTSIVGFATIRPGIQLNSTPSIGALFQGTATNTDLLDNINSTQFLRSDENDSTTGTLAVLTDAGFSVGADQDFQVAVSGTAVTMRNQTLNGNLSLEVNRAGSPTTVLSAIGTTGNINIPGNVVVSGNVSAAFFSGDGSQLTGISATGNSISDGTSLVRIIATNGNIQANVNGSTVQTISSQGLNIAGNVWLNSTNTAGVALANPTTLGVGFSGGAGAIFTGTTTAGNAEFTTGNLNVNGNVWVNAGGLVGFTNDGTNIGVGRVGGPGLIMTGTGATGNTDVVSGNLNVLGNIWVAEPGLVGFTNTGTVIGVGRVGGPGLVFPNTTAGTSGNLDVIAGNLNLSGNKLIVGSNAAGLVDNTSVSPNLFAVGYENVNGIIIENIAAPNGNIFFTAANVGKPGGGSFYATSDQRLKANIRDYDVGLGTILELNPKRYDLLDRERKVRDGVDQVQIPDHVGLVAQEVQLTDLAEMVFEDRDGYLNIDNTKLTFALVNAVKELKQELDDLRAKMPRS